MAAKSPLKLVVFLGSTREGRLGDRVFKYVKGWIQNEMSYFHVELMDPLEMDFPMLKKPLHFYRGAEQNQAPKELVEANQKIKDADAFLLISCEYNHCIPPGLANLIDHFPGSSFSWRPSGLITYSPGIYGGMRAAMQLRAFTGEIGCISVSNIFGIPKVHDVLDEHGVDKDPKNSHLSSGMQKLMYQLEWHARAMKNWKEKDPPK